MSSSVSSRVREIAVSIPALAYLVREFKWRLRLSAMGARPERVFLSIPPGHFYSPLPSAADVRRAVASRSVTSTALPGIELDAERQIALLRSLLDYFPASAWLAGEPRVTRYDPDNIYFSVAEARVLHAVVGRWRPKRVIEVGSGFSSAVLLDAREAFALERMTLTCIDPDPSRLRSLLRPSDADASVRVIASPVQDVPLAEFESLEAGDLLFIDSSHVAKAGSDVCFLIFEVMPRLAPGVLVHVHDIFWPFEYPEDWFAVGRAWNEAYLLRAYLLDNARCEILLFTSWIEKVLDVDTRAAWLGGNPAAVAAAGRPSSLYFVTKR